MSEIDSEKNAINVNLIGGGKIHPYTGQYVIIRTYAAGVHIGILKEYDFTTNHVFLTLSRRLWYWEGAFTLSAVAMNGIKGGKLSMVIPEIMIARVEEIIPCSKTAENNLKEFPTHNPGVSNS